MRTRCDFPLYRLFGICFPIRTVTSFAHSAPFRSEPLLAFDILKEMKPIFLPAT